MEKLDVVIIGAGVVGLAIGRAFSHLGREVTILEAQQSFGMETSSRNSEVIHAGIYYPTNSLKAKLCVSGKHRLYQYCRERDIPHRKLGKLIVATTESETEQLLAYQAQAVANGVNDLGWLHKDDLNQLEPDLQAVCALHSPSTGIIDSHQLMFSFVSDISNAGGTLVYDCKVIAGELSDQGPIINIAGEDSFALQCNLLVNAAGLDSQATAKVLGLSAELIPDSYFAKGHYFTTTQKVPFRHLVYPVANNASLGIHLTLDMSNQARFGPDVEWLDRIDYGFDEARKADFVKAIRQYFPDLDEAALQPGYTGIRPKLVGHGSPPSDFIIQDCALHGLPGLINCYGIESPGLTASMAIAEHVAQLPSALSIPS